MAESAVFATVAFAAAEVSTRNVLHALDDVWTPVVCLGLLLAVWLLLLLGGSVGLIGPVQEADCCGEVEIERAICKTCGTRSPAPRVLDFGLGCLAIVITRVLV
jgi:hypothetical protein